MVDAKFEAAIAEYRPSNWTDAQFEAACEQAADNNCFCEHPIESDEWLGEYIAHLAEIVEGRIPNSYWRGN